MIKQQSHYKKENNLCLKIKNQQQILKPHLVLLIANATVSFNMICSAKQLKSNYVNIRNNDKTPQHKTEIANAIRFREDVEMNILYRKEQHLNQRISYLNMDGVYQYEGIRENFKLNIDLNLCRFVQLLYKT